MTNNTQLILNRSSNASPELLLDTPFHHSLAREPHALDVINDHNLDSRMALDFIFWVCNSLQEDIFGVIKIDPNKVAKDLGYKTKTHFHEVVPDPEHLKNKSLKQIDQMINTGHFIFRTRFENMIYKLWTIEIELHHRDDTKDPKFTSFKLRKERLFEEIEIRQDKSFKDKKYYYIKLSNYFLENLSRTYLLCNKKSYITLARAKQKNLQHLYLKLATLKEWMRKRGHQSYSVPFDDLCNVVGINDYKTQAKKKSKLIEYLNKVQEEAPSLHLSYFFSKNGNYNYKPIFSFSNNVVFSKDQKIRTKIKIFDSIVIYCYTQEFEKLFPTVEHKEDYANQFHLWFLDPNSHRTQKKRAYCTAHKIFWNKTIKPTDARVEKYINDRVHILPEDNK